MKQVGFTMDARQRKNWRPVVPKHPRLYGMIEGSGTGGWIPKTSYQNPGCSGSSNQESMECESTIRRNIALPPERCTRWTALTWTSPSMMTSCLGKMAKVQFWWWLVCDPHLYRDGHVAHLDTWWQTSVALAAGSGLPLGPGVYRQPDDGTFQQGSPSVVFGRRSALLHIDVKTRWCHGHIARSQAYDVGKWWRHCHDSVYCVCQRFLKVCILQAKK